MYLNGIDADFCHTPPYVPAHKWLSTSGNGRFSAVERPLVSLVSVAQSALSSTTSGSASAVCSELNPSTKLAT